jgi:hypothetical protein
MIVELIVRDVELSSVVRQRTHYLLVVVVRRRSRSMIMSRQVARSRVHARVGRLPTKQC